MQREMTPAEFDAKKEADYLAEIVRRYEAGLPLDRDAKREARKAILARAAAVQL